MTPLPGMTGLAEISGYVGAGIRWAQKWNGDGFSRWEHAFTVLPGGMILEAEPGGAVIRPLHYSNVYWCNGIYALLPPAAYAAARLDAIAGELKGIGYSFLDYDALAAKRLHLYPLYPLLRARITSQHTMICSQMADEFVNRLGGHIFTDGRWPGDVTPGSLWRRDAELRRTP